MIASKLFSFFLFLFLEIFFFGGSSPGKFMLLKSGRTGEKVVGGNVVGGKVVGGKVVGEKVVGGKVVGGGGKVVFPGNGGRSKPGYGW